MFPQKICCYTRGTEERETSGAWLARIEQAISSPLAVLKADGMKRSFRAEIPPWGHLLLSEFRWDMGRILLSPFRMSRAARIWAYSDELIQNGICISESVIFIEIRRACFVTRTYIAYRWEDDRTDLGQIRTSGKNNSRYDLKTALNLAVDAIARLHNAGFIHGDLKWSNLNCIFEDGQPKLVIGDLDGLRKSASCIRQGKDFARFILDGIRFQIPSAQIQQLTDRYLRQRQHSVLLRLGLRHRIARKRRKYERMARAGSESVVL